MSCIIPETCDAIWTSLAPLFMPTPGRDQWTRIANRFFEKWDFPNCIGSIDGKHVLIQKPSLSGSLYYNYKKTCSIVLLAVADADCRFVVVDVGAYGRQNDGNVLQNSEFGKRLASHTLHLPADALLPGSNTTAPHVYVGDEAFPLQRHLMRPFPGCSLNGDDRRIYNYRLSRARRTVENAFGIMASRFRIFRKPMCISPENADRVIKASTVLHNYLMEQATHQSEMEAAVENDGVAMHPLNRIGRRPTNEAMRIRDKFVEYFVDVGARPLNHAAV